MNNNYKALKKQTIHDVFSQSSELMTLRRRLFFMLCSFCVLRAAFCIYEVVFLCLRSSDLSFMIPNLSLTLLCVLFSYAIYNGASTISFLGVLGGLYSLLTNISEKVIEYITTKGDVAYNVYFTLLIALAVGEIILYGYIGLSRNYKKYFGACLEVNNRLSMR